MSDVKLLLGKCMFIAGQAIRFEYKDKILTIQCDDEVCKPYYGKVLDSIQINEIIQFLQYAIEDNNEQSDLG
jgi:hypothetical protein